MRYVDTTIPQFARVLGGWIIGYGIAIAFLSFGELFNGARPTGMIWSVSLVGGGLLLFGPGDAITRRGRRNNIRFFSMDGGTAVLRTRRRIEKRAALARNIAAGLVVLLSGITLFLASTLVCVTDDACTGIIAYQREWTDAMRIVTLSVLAITLALATFSRITTAETDHLEMLGSDTLRRRDDGPLPGSKGSVWE